MLLNRQRVKFWQKIVFGFMAALMAGFLIFGYSGVASGCRNANLTHSGNSALDSQVKAALTALDKNPDDATALLSAAQAYQAAGYVQSGLPSATQTDNLTKALTYYERYRALPDSTLGSAADGLRFRALQNETAIYIELVDYKSAVATYKKMLKLEPTNYDLYLGIASNSASAGDRAGAIAAYKTFLARDPHSQYAPQVKVALAQLSAQSSPSPSASP